MANKISTHFYLYEFVPKEIYERWGDRSVWFVDRRIILLADFVRDRFGKGMIINNWHDGGQFNYRGFRQRSCEIGGELSQHRFGRAIDFNIVGLTPVEVYKDIIDNQDMYIRAGVTTVEDIEYTNGWTHLDIRPSTTDTNQLLIVKP